MTNASNTPLYVLASGGIDSTALVHFYASKGYKVQLIFLDFGQLSRTRERNAVRRIAKYFSVSLQIIHIKGGEATQGGFMQGRNAMLVFVALAQLSILNGIISLGIHSGTQYPDCSQGFIAAMQEVLDIYSDGLIQLEAPFKEWDKQQVMSYAFTNTLPVRLTYSCELGRRQPCGKCSSCKDLEQYNRHASQN